MRRTRIPYDSRFEGLVPNDHSRSNPEDAEGRRIHDASRHRKLHRHDRARSAMEELEDVRDALEPGRGTDSSAADPDDELPFTD